jgi:two-component system, OmpR family, phosphate regulon sensor histidine kinase PhoR
LTRLLVVDDASETRQFLAENILAPEGYEVFTAQDGQAAYELILKTPPDLIISDYQMPQMNGLDLLAGLHEVGIHIPFILITAEGSEALVLRALRLGAADYLTKPFEISELLAAVERALARNPISKLLHHAVDGILAVDAQNRITFCNQEAKRALRLDNEIEGQPVTRVLRQPALLTIFDGTPLETRRYEIQTDDERIWNLQVSSNGTGGALLIMQDISQLKELDRAKTDFVTTISHDLRSPLTAIMGYVELLQRTGSLNDQQKQFTENILFSVRSITALLTDLLELSKIEAGRDITLEPTKMDIIIRYAVETLRNELDLKQQTLNVDIEPGSSSVLGNPIRLKQMLVNLLQNAIKYTPKTGNVSIKLYKDGAFIILQVVDTGIGISAEDLPYIWDKFYRTDEAAENFPGTGLGLAIVKSIVDAHSGRIWTSSTQGTGSTFTVMLPAQELAPA